MRTYELEQEESTRIFINKAGGITIEQGDERDESIQVIAFGSKERLFKVIRILRELSKINQWQKEEE